MMDMGSIIPPERANQEALQDKNQVKKSQELRENIVESGSKEGRDEELEEAISEFVSLFLYQMFSTMRDTVPDNELIDGGFAEDVFTEMMDEEISRLGAQQNQFKQLNEAIYRQLTPGE